MKPQLFFVALCTASSLAFAQVKPEGTIGSYAADRYTNKVVPFDRAIKSLVWSLTAANEGVTKSALSHIVKVRVANPSIGMDEAESAVKDLIVNGATPLVRYEAFLATAVMENPGLISKSECEGCMTPEKLFSTVAAKLQNANFGPEGPSISSKH